MIGILIWFVGFEVIGGEWFTMAKRYLERIGRSGKGAWFFGCGVDIIAF